MLYLIHYGEIALKKGNRDFFERALISNIKKVFEGGTVSKRYGRILLEVPVILSTEKDLMDSSTLPQNNIENKLSKIFGIANFSEVQSAPLDLKKAADLVLKLLKGRKFKTFKVETKRGNKNFPMTSQEISAEMGSVILSASGNARKSKDLTVDLHNPELTVYLEVTEKEILISTDKKQGPGGLPVGSSGKVLSLLSSGIDSPVASWMMTKRGANTIFIHFHSFPYTKKDSIENVKKIIGVLKEWGTPGKVYVVGIGELQKHLLTLVPKRLLVVFYRRFMVRIAEKIAYKENAKALVTGDALGQVASQTLENINVINEVATMPILRPLIGFDKQEIITLAERIDTFEISKLPYEDCCTMFVPQHPETRADLNEVLEIEKTLSINELMDLITIEKEVL